VADGPKVGVDGKDGRSKGKGKGKEDRWMDSISEP
jgi:hypothetical protein